MAFNRISLDEFPGKSLVLIEEDSGDLKRLFVQMIAAEALANGKMVTYVTPRMKADVVHEMQRYLPELPDMLEVIERTRDNARLVELCKGEVCIIENFPLFVVDALDREVVHLLIGLVHSCRDNGRMIFLTADKGVLPERAQKIVRSLSDGVIDLMTVFVENRINRYIYILKMRESAPLNAMIPFSVDGSGTRIFIDTRERYA